MTYMWFQEKALALAKNEPVPALCSSADIRPLSMDDFKYAQEQVPQVVNYVSIIVDF